MTTELPMKRRIARLVLIAGPTVIEAEICRMYRTEVIGRAAEVRESFYAISPERKLKHDAVVAITDIARKDLFSNGH